MVVLQNFIANYIYQKLEKEFEYLEPFFYIATETKNNALVFCPNEIDYIPKYFNKEEIFSYEIVYFSPRQNFNIALFRLEEILKILTSWNYSQEILIFNEAKFKIDILYLNQKPIPEKEWIRPNLLQLDSESQTYSFNLGIKLNKII